MPEYEVTRADGSTETLAARSVSEAADRAGGHPEVISARLKGGRRSAAQVMAEQPRHSSFALGASTIGQCPVPGCDYISSAHGELQAHGLDEHGFAFGVSKRG